MFDYAAYSRRLREELHRIPEIGFDLPKTLAVVHRELDAMGLTYTDKYGPSSVVAYINPGRPFTVGLRADMDALPIQEENDVPYKSTHEGRMHACGHDCHTANLLAVAKQLMDRKDELKCTVKLMFTPAEEYEIPGCGILVQNGIMDDVDCAIALHVVSRMNVGEFEMTDEDIGSNSQGFRIRFYGKSAHAVGQQDGKDAIMMALETMLAMEVMIAKEIHVSKPKVLNFGSIHGGHTNNVICDFVEVYGSCRSGEDELSAFIERRLREICKGMELTTGGRIEFETMKLLPYRVNNPVLYQKMYATAVRLFGAENIKKPPMRGMGGEDFGYMTRKKPCLFIQYGVKNKNVAKASPGHSNTFDVDPQCYQAPIDLLTGFIFDHMDGIEF